MAAWNELVKLNAGVVVGVLAASAAGGIGNMSNILKIHMGSSGGALCDTTGTSIVGWTDLAVNIAKPLTITFTSGVTALALKATGGATAFGAFVTEDTGVRFECFESTSARIYDFRTYIGGDVNTILISSTTGLWTMAYGLAITGGTAAAGSITRSGTTWTLGNGPTITEAGAATFLASVTSQKYKAGDGTTTADATIYWDCGAAAIWSAGIDKDSNTLWKLAYNTGANLESGISILARAGGRIELGTGVLTPYVYGIDTSATNLNLQANAANTTTGAVAILTSTEAAVGGTGALTVAGGIYVTKALFGGSTATFATSVTSPLLRHSAATGGNLVIGNNIADSAAQFNFYGLDGTLADFTPFLALRTNTFAAGDISLRFILDTTSTIKQSYISSSFGDGTACGLHFTAYQTDVGGYNAAGQWVFSVSCSSPLLTLTSAAATGRIRYSPNYADAGTRDWLITTDFDAYGDFQIRKGVNKGDDPYSAGTKMLEITSGGAFTINSAATTSFSINSATNGSSQVYIKENGGTKWSYYNDASNDRFTLTDSNGDAGVYIAQDATAWTAYSDRRLKRLGSIKPLENCIATLMKVDPVSFQYRKDSINSIPRQGFIAQDVFKVFPYAVDVGMTEKCMWGVTPTNFIPLLIGSVKEMYIEMKKENDLLRSRIEQLERSLAA